MEPGVKAYLMRILNTGSLCLLWMIINATIGIKYEYGLLTNPIGLGNILFYIFLVLSFLFFLRWAIRTWQKPIDYDN